MNDQNDIQQTTDNATNTLRSILQLMGFEAKIETFAGSVAEEVLFHIESKDAARLIGRNAQVLQALQFVLNRMLHRPDKPGPHYVVDIERYRERRKDRILKEALDAAQQVEEGHGPITLPPMESSDRRIVHQALRDHTRVKTYSLAEDAQGMKCVVVAPADMESPEAASPSKAEEPQQPVE